VSRILIVEDEARLAAFLEKGLRAAGYTTTVAADGIAGSALARDDDFDLIVLDLGLPGRDGFEVLRDVRGAGQRLPVIILTARDEAGDRVAGLEAGADDYLGKPFHFEELLARIRLRLRSAAAGDENDDGLTVGGISLDERTRWVKADGRTVELSAREFELLKAFLRHPEQVMSREQLLAHVWGYGYDPGSNVVDVYVGYLRKKLGAERFETVRGVGYRFRPQGRNGRSRRS
jgi:DNA-binding response OmpR family regulator